MATSLSSVDGLVSGMNTTQIISQLMQLEQQPQARLVQQRSDAQVVMASYQAVNLKFSALQTAATTLTSASEWTKRAVSSSSTAVTASAAPGALTGSIVFDVQQIAKAQSYVSAGTFSSTSAIVTTSPSVTITKGSGTPVTVNTGTGSLSDVVAAINASSAGVKAAAVQVSPGTYKLQLTSTTTGAASNFAIADGANTTPFGALTSLVTGQDAMLVVGDPASAGRYTLTSATNTVTDVLPGLTLNVSAPATAVTVNVTSDVGALANDVQAMVDAANAALGEMANQTAYDPSTKQGAPLVGDSTVRVLQQQVLGIVTDAVGGLGNAAKAGLEVAKDGTITFKSDVFTAAYNADPEGTAKLFRPGGTTTHANPAYAALAGKVSFLTASDQTARGSYDVKITSAATQAHIDVTGVPAAGEQLTFTVAGKSPVVVTAQSGDTMTTLATRVNAAVGQLGLVATESGGVLTVDTANYGSLPTFGLTTSGGLSIGPLVAGTDVAGSINGVVSIGTGQVLVAPAEDSTLHGMALLVTATPTDVATAAGEAGADANLFGTFAYTPGVAQRLLSLSGDAIRTGTGRLSTVIAGKQSMVDDLTQRITDWDGRLATKEADYRRQYASLETALGKLRDQSNWLSGQLAGLPSK